MELREALTQISEIRQRVAQAEVFRGYRAVPVAFSGLLALATACVQIWPAQGYCRSFSRGAAEGAERILCVLRVSA